MRDCSDIESSTRREDREFGERKWAGPLSSSFCRGNPQFTVNAQHSLDGSDQQTVQPGAVQRETFIDAEMGLGGLMGHMSEHEVWGTFLPTERVPSSPRCRKINSEA